MKLKWDAQDVLVAAKAVVVEDVNILVLEDVKMPAAEDADILALEDVKIQIGDFVSKTVMN